MSNKHQRISEENTNDRYILRQKYDPNNYLKQYGNESPLKQKNKNYPQYIKKSANHLVL